MLWGFFFQRKISSFLSDWACSCSFSTSIIFLAVLSLCGEHSTGSGEEPLPWETHSPNRWEKKPKKKNTGLSLRSHRTSSPGVANTPVCGRVLGLWGRELCSKELHQVWANLGLQDPRVVAPMWDWKGCSITSKHLWHMSPEFWRAFSSPFCV